MRWEEWKFSAQRAAQDHFVRWTAVSTVVMFASATAYLFFKLLPLALKTSIVVVHYNIYLGIDDVRKWQWLFSLPAVALALIICDLLFSFGNFRRDATASRALTAVAFISTALWAVGSFFIILINS